MQNDPMIHEVMHSGYDENGVFHPVRPANVVEMPKREHEEDNNDYDSGDPLATFKGLLFGLFVEFFVLLAGFFAYEIYKLISELIR